MTWFRVNLEGREKIAILCIDYRKFIVEYITEM